MSDMQVSMRLTLADFASGPLAEFTAKLEGLQALAARVTRSFNTMGRGAVDSAGGMAKLQTTLAGIAEGLAGIEAKLNAAADSFLNVGRSASITARSVSAATGEMSAAGDTMVAVTGKVNSLATSLKGMAEIWAAFKIEKGLKASFEQAATLQTQAAAMQAGGYSADDARYAMQWSMQFAQRYPFASSNEIMAARRAYMQATGQNNERVINATIRQVLQNAFLVQQVAGGSLSDIVKNMVGIAEQRGLSMSGAGILRASNLAVRLAEATQGRMNLQKQEMVLRQYKYGGAQLASDEGIAYALALGEQYTLAGHGGGGGGGSRGVSQVGSALSMVLKTMLGGKMNKVTYDLLSQMGLIDRSATIGKTTTTSLNSLTYLKNSAAGERNPIGWLMNTLGPAMVAYVEKHPEYFQNGHVVTSGPAFEEALGRLVAQLFGPTGGVNVANMAYMAVNPGTAGRIRATVERTQQAAVGQQGIDIFNKTANANIEKFRKSVADLATSLGQTLLPIVTQVVEWLTRIVNKINKLADRFPDLTSWITKAAAAFALFLAIRGFSNLIGGLRNIALAFREIAAASTAAKVKSEAALAAMTAGGVLGAGGAEKKAAGAAAEGEAAASASGGLLGKLETFVKGISPLAFVAVPANTKPIAQQNAYVGTMEKEDAGKSYWWRLTHMFSPVTIPKAEIAIPKLRPPHGAPDIEGQTAANLQNAANQENLPTQVDLGSPSGSTRSHHARATRTPRVTVSPQVKAALAAMKQRMARLQAATAAINEAKAGGPRSPASIKAKYAGYANILNEFGLPDMADQATAIGEHLANQAGYQQSTDQLEKLQRQLDSEAQATASRVRLGSLTKLGGENADIALQKQIAPAMQQAAEAALKYAQALKDPALIAAMQAQLANIQAMGTQLNSLQKGIMGSAQGGLSTFLEQSMRANVPIRSMLAQLNNTIMAGINRNVSQTLSQDIMGMFQNSSIGQSFLGAFGGNAGSSGGGSGSGGWMSAIGSLIGSFFGGGGGAWSNASMASTASSVIGSIEGFATGTDYVPNDMVAQIHQGEMIIPAAGAASIRNGALAGHTINMNINAMDSQSVLGAMDNVKRELAQMLAATASAYNLG